MSLHAAVCVPAHDRRRLERLVRYVARSPLSLERLSRTPDGRLVYKLKRRWRDGTTHVVFEPADFITKLAALVPPPRAHLVRYHGLLAPCASERDRVVPGARTPTTTLAAHTTCQPNMIAPGGDTRAGARSVSQSASNENVPLPRSARAGHGSARPTPKNNNRTNKRPSWAELMRRVWALDVLACPRCAGRMRIIAAICGSEAKNAILECLGLPSRAPPTAEPTADDDPYDAWSTASRGFTSDHETD